MTFDPFGDFGTRGYRRNSAGLHDPAAVKAFEHAAFLDKLDDAFTHLRGIKALTYADVLAVHGTLFEDVYPWAGQDRVQTAPDIAVTKGTVLFAHPNDVRAAIDYALRLGQDATIMARKPGEIMGYLAYGHPFLDGNGRTIMTVHAVLAERAGISIDWAATDKVDYLTALTRELDEPGKGHLDAYLKPFVGTSIGQSRLAGHLTRTAGLDGLSRQPSAANEIAGKFSDPAVQGALSALAATAQPERPEAVTTCGHVNRLLRLQHRPALIAAASIPEPKTRNSRLPTFQVSATIAGATATMLCNLSPHAFKASRFSRS